MKSHSIGALGAASFATAAAAFMNGTASAQVLGLTATTRLQSDGNYLVNVFAVAGAATNALTSVSGGQLGSISTNAVGGFRQGAGPQGVWAPAGSQNWTTLDSFLTGGGSFLTSSNNWTGNTTNGDPTWLVEYFDTGVEENVIINAFSNASNGTGFTNPYGSGAVTLPTIAGGAFGGAGWFLAPGTTSMARSLATLTALGRQNADAQGQIPGSAAAGTFGIMIAQFYVSGQTSTGAGAKIFFNNMRVFFANTDNRLIESFTIDIPAPGALALLGIARLAGGRRRLA